MAVTLKDIAKASGYSITTVSRALAGYSDVSEKTRNHIKAIAEKLGYQPNHIARQLRSQKTRTIGLILPEAAYTATDEFFSLFMMGIGHAASLYHYDLLLGVQITGDDEIVAYQRMVGENRVDGMIIARTKHHDQRVAYLQSSQTPFVVFGRLDPSHPHNFAYIDVDSTLGIQCGMEHLISLGHRHIGLILSPLEMVYTDYRLQGYQKGLTAAQLPFREEYIVVGDLKTESGYALTHTLLDSQPQITAIVACNDHMALGSIKAAQERGLRVGHDISIMGYDDIVAAAHAHPSLTTIRQPIFEIGEQVAALLIQQIEKLNSINAQHTLLEPTLVVRESTGPCIHS
ncbi:MAG: LacI family transcriptional regulator [Phototrophicales bacterium]|nr:MAG: LacI family transcriptional regulator [Phototrophicales bacterium]